LDGTLWDATEIVAHAWNTVLSRVGENGRILDVSQVTAVMGMAHRELCATLLPGLPEARQDALALACYEEERRLLLEYGARLYPGVAEGLRRLAQRCPLFIVSNCQRGYIEVFLAWSGLGALVRDHECHGNTGADKAQNLRSVLQRNELTTALYVGDTEGDRLAAAAAGIPFIHAAYGFGRVPDALRRVSAFAELVRWLAP
jgi:phosphoglycolate phosphatase